MATIGLIAGGGRFPILFAESARRAGHRVVAVAHRSETDPAPLALPGSETLVERSLEGIVVKGGTCEVGINIDAKAADWVNVDLFSFERVGPIE